MKQVVQRRSLNDLVTLRPSAMTEEASTPGQRTSLVCFVLFCYSPVMYAISSDSMAASSPLSCPSVIAPITPLLPSIMSNR